MVVGPSWAQFRPHTRHDNHAQLIQSGRAREEERRGAGKARGRKGEGEERRRRKAEGVESVIPSAAKLVCCQCQSCREIVIDVCVYPGGECDYKLHTSNYYLNVQLKCPIVRPIAKL